MDLLGDLLDIWSEKRSKKTKEFGPSSKRLKILAYPGEPMSLDDVSLSEVMVGENFEEQIAMPIGGGMLECLLVDLLGFAL